MEGMGHNPSGGELVKAIEQVLNEDGDDCMGASDVHTRVTACHPEWSLSKRRVAKFIKRAHSGNPITLPYEEASQTEASVGSLSVRRFLRRRKADDGSVRSGDRSLRSVGTSISKFLRRKKKKNKCDNNKNDDNDSLLSGYSLRSIFRKKPPAVKRRGKRDKVAHSPNEELVHEPDPVSSEEKDAIKAAIEDILQQEATRQKILDNMTREDHNEEELRNIGGVLGSPYHDDNDRKHETGCVSWWDALFPATSQKVSDLHI